MLFHTLLHAEIFMLILHKHLLFSLNTSKSGPKILLQKHPACIRFHRFFLDVIYENSEYTKKTFALQGQEDFRTKVPSMLDKSQN